MRFAGSAPARSAIGKSKSRAAKENGRAFGPAVVLLYVEADLQVRLIFTSA